MVSEIADGRLTLRLGDVRLPVEITLLGYDPFDHIGSQKLNVGDTVTVGGVLERNARTGLACEQIA